MKPVLAFMSFSARLVLGVTFLLSGVGKMGHPTVVFTVGKFIHNAFPVGYDLLAKSLFALPGVEIVAGVFLLLGLLTRAHAVLVCVLLAGFMSVLAFAWSRGVPLRSCFCFGSETRAISYGEIFARDGVLLLLALFTACGGGGLLSVDIHLRRRCSGRGKNLLLASSIGLAPLAVLAVLLLVHGTTEGARNLARPGAIEGRVFGPSGQGVADCLILDDKRRFLGLSDSSGGFSLKPDRSIAVLTVVPPEEYGWTEESVRLPRLTSVVPGVVGYSLVVRLGGD